MVELVSVVVVVTEVVVFKHVVWVVVLDVVMANQLMLVEIKLLIHGENGKTHHSRSAYRNSIVTMDRP